MQVLRTIVLGFLSLCLISCARDPGRLSRQGLEKLEAGDAAGAAQKFGRAIQGMEASSEVAVLWNALGVSEAWTGREEEAEAAFRTAIRLDASLWVPAVNLALLYRGQGRTAEAEELFGQAMRLSPDRAEVLEFRATEALRSGNLDQAVAWMQEAVQRNPTSRSLSSLAVMTVGELSVEERRSLLLQAVTADPQNAAAQLNLAALLDQHRFDPEQAGIHYEAFLRLSPESTLVSQVSQRLQVMEARVSGGQVTQPDPVRNEVEALLEQASGATDSREALVFSLRAHAVAARANRVDLRERALRAGATLVPTSPRAFVGLARLVQEQGRDQEALEVFREAYRLAPAWEPAWSGVAGSLIRLGDISEVRKFLDEVEARSADQPDVLLSIADFYTKIPGRDRRAVELYQRVIKEFPETEAAVQAKQRLSP